MSDRFELYVVDESRLPSTLPRLSDQQKFEKLVEAVQKTGALWETINLPEEQFAGALEKVDEKLKGNGFLPVLSFNNSPNNLLGDYGDCPCFGYFNVEMVGDLRRAIEALASYMIDELKLDDKTSAVLTAYRSATEQAVQRDYALAVLHA